MQKEKKLTEEDITLLFSEGWLTVQQQNAFNVFEGTIKTLEEVEKLCSDQVVINFIFEEKKIEPTNIHYNVVKYYRGEALCSETFDNLNDAIICTENLQKASGQYYVKIEVTYSLIK